MNIGEKKLGEILYEEVVKSCDNGLFNEAYESGFNTAIRQVQSVIKRDFKGLKDVSVEDLCKHIEKCFNKESE